MTLIDRGDVDGKIQDDARKKAEMTSLYKLAAMQSTKLQFFILRIHIVLHLTPQNL